MGSIVRKPGFDAREQHNSNLSLYIITVSAGPLTFHGPIQKGWVGVTGESEPPPPPPPPPTHTHTHTHTPPWKISFLRKSGMALCEIH